MPDTAGRQPKRTLKQIIEQTDTAGGRTLDVAIQVLIIFSLVTFSLDTLPDLTGRQKAILDWLEFATVMIFTVEYSLRVWVSSDRRGFIFSFFGLVDLIAIIPFYLSHMSGLSLDLRAVRLLRLLKLARYHTEVVTRFRRAFIIAKGELLLFLFVTVILFYFAGVGIYYFENAAQPEAFASVFHSLWWAVITLTTVGYGDIIPVTIGGRCFTFVVLILGLGVVAIPAGLIASALTKAREME